MPSSPLKIFINYRTLDTGHATRLLATTLSQKFGPAAIFVDTESMQLGKWPEQINQALAKVDICLVLMGPQWLNEENRARLNEEKDLVRKEIEISIQRNIIIVPVLIDGARLPDVKAVPESLFELTREDSYEHVLLRHRSWDSDVDVLVRRLRSLGCKRIPAKRALASRKQLPRIVLMDSYQKIYDRKSASLGMNSHVIRDLLRDVRAQPIDIEPVHPAWHGADAVARKKPNLIVIHYSCMDKTTRPRNLQDFLRYILLESKNTKVIVYSRTTARPGDTDAAGRFQGLIDDLAGRHKDRVFGLPIYRYRNRTQKFTDEKTEAALRRLVKDVLRNT
jgi:hypothetical protein